MGEREIDRLPDPETFRDAMLLAESGVLLTPSELDGMDALLLGLLTRLKATAKRGA